MTVTLVLKFSLMSIVRLNIVLHYDWLHSSWFYTLQSHTPHCFALCLATFLMVLHFTEADSSLFCIMIGYIPHGFTFYIVTLLNYQSHTEYNIISDTSDLSSTLF